MTSKVNGKTGTLTPCRSETPENVITKIGHVDYVAGATRMPNFMGIGLGVSAPQIEVDRISASVSVSAPNVDKWALSADIRFRPKAVVSHSVHFRFRWAAVGKFGGC